jgi:hypothetical protein
MTRAENTADKIGELIDSIERIREELLAIQRSMEKMESSKPRSGDGTKENQV